MPLEEYKRKRKFDETPEPSDGVSKRPQFRFVVQKHRASHLHFDFRLEMHGVLVSWAVPKGPSLDPADKRLAMHVEDHPISYFHFEGIIPAGNYGAGTVQVWDTGSWEPVLDWGKEEIAPKKRISKAEAERAAAAMYEKGDFKFRLNGEKLKGAFVLAKMKRARYGKDNEWLLIKKSDETVVAPYDANDAQEDWSVLTRRSLEQIAKDEGSAEWESNRKAQEARPKDAWLQKALAKKATTEKRAQPKEVAKKRSSKKKTSSGSDVEEALAALPGAKRGPMPREVRPMLATLVDEPFDDPQSEWLYEIKWDGYRAVCFIDGGKVRIVSRNGNDLAKDFPEMADVAEQIQLQSAVLDGEICALDDEGRPSFSLMQQRTGLRTMGKRTGADAGVPIVYYLFDLLYANGYSLMRVGLEQRKEILKQVLQPDDRFRLSDHFSDGRALYEAAKAKQLEGIVAKRRTSSYEQKRSRDWLKVKVTQRQECVIAGYTDPKGSRENYGALVLGLYNREGKLVHVGQAGTGFTQRSHAALWAKLQKLATDKNPFGSKVEANRRVHFVEPKLVAEIKFVEWTHEGESGGVKMRAPVFMGLREDKSARECVFDFPKRTRTMIA